MPRRTAPPIDAARVARVENVNLIELMAPFGKRLVSLRSDPTAGEHSWIFATRVRSAG